MNEVASRKIQKKIWMVFIDLEKISEKKFLTQHTNVIDDSCVSVKNMYGITGNFGV